MAFNNFLTPVWLAPGGTQTWQYTFGGDRGLQIAGADVKTPGSTLWAQRQGKSMDGNGNATYFVEIHNDGPQWAFYNLQGGGAA